MSRSGIALLALLALGQAAAVFAQDNTHEWHHDDIFHKFFDHNLLHMHNHNGMSEAPTSEPALSSNSTGRRLSQNGNATAPLSGSSPQSRMENLKTYVEDALKHLRDTLASDKHAILDAAKSGMEGMKKWSDHMMVDLKNSNLQPGMFLNDVLGSNFSSYLPTSWDNMTNWSTLMGFDFQGSMTDFVDAMSLQNLSKTQSLAELYAELEKVISAFCSGPTPVDGEKVPAACTGPSVTLELVPKTCTLDDISKTLTCSPATLELIKTPATCHHKYYSPYSYTGKECAITGTIGISKTVTVGGEIFDIVLSDHNTPGANANPANANPATPTGPPHKP